MSSRLIVSALRSSAANAARRSVLSSIPKLVATRGFAYSPVSYAISNDKLLRVLNEELEVVKTIDLKEGDKEINDFIAKTKFQLSQEPDSALVQLSKTLDNGEIVRIFFDVEKVSNAAQQDQDFAEEDVEAAEEEESDLGSGFSNVYAIIENKNQSGLLFELSLQNFSDAFIISSITPVANVPKYVEEFANKGVYYDDVTYQGPEFMNLDESLQLEFETYLQERGFNEELLEFIVFASEHKEEGEYRKWLTTVKNFIEN